MSLSLNVRLVLECMTGGRLIPIVRPASDLFPGVGRIYSGTVANMVLHLKPWLSILDQINQLRIRGMEIPDRDQASHALKIIGYYRLSGYWYLYREPHPTQKDQRLDDFLPGTQFTEILALYHFDSALKGLICAESRG